VIGKRVGRIPRPALFHSNFRNRQRERYSHSAINLKKYAWQFGTTDFKTAIDGVMVQAKPVDCSGITCPSLFLVSEGEGPELQRQTRVLFDDFSRRGVRVTLREFTAAEGADGHCGLNKLRRVHLVIFDWLDRIFALEPGNVRVYC
jgi:hypothetical protein